MTTNYDYPGEAIEIIKGGKGYIIISEDGSIACNDEPQMNREMITAWNKYSKTFILDEIDIEGSFIDFWRYIRSAERDQYGFVDPFGEQEHFPKYMLQIIKEDDDRDVLRLCKHNKFGESPNFEADIVFETDKLSPNEEPIQMTVTDENKWYMSFSASNSISHVNKLMPIIGAEATCILKDIMHIACKKMKEAR